MNNANHISFHLVNSAIQKVALYETKTRLLLVGSNDRETKFRCLELDRTARSELKFHEYPNEYDARGIRMLVGTLGQCKKISAYGVLGLIRFLESYYMILVTKRTKCGVIGKHIIYTIKDTTMIRVWEPSVKQTHPLEQRYLRMFTNIDLNSNFYFSYSYDLTRTLQHNLSAPRFIGRADIENEEPLADWKCYKSNNTDKKVEFAIRSVSRKRFVWNAYLLKPMSKIVNRDWMLEVIHGFVSQSNINIFGRSVHVCLIARRSTRFAGTRFLKRGANFAGDVANEVESEQIVVDGQRMCSFTQMRGSIPSHWSQDISKMVPKPPISLDLSDPYATTAGKHYSRLMFHFGAPIIILNLVKKREKRRHESILTADMTTSINYLNQFLPPQHRIKYHHFDMAKKSHGGNVMSSLEKFAENFVQKTGLFFKDSNDVSFQTGIARVNCVDCLDRTNTAQFAIGKTALAHQLHRLGFLKAPPKLVFDSDCVTMLESLYEDHGDTLALQYGGSQLVHRIKTYRKTAAWTSQGNDFMQTLSRYYSNTFSDTEKQHSMNIFLGYFRPLENKENIPIWDLPTDYFMHNPQSDIEKELQLDRPLTEFVSPFTLKHLPYSTSDGNRIVDELIRVHSQDECLEIIDYYSSYHIPYKWTSFEENIAYTISHMARCFTPTFRTNYSPFEPATRRFEGRGILKNPSLTGQSSTGSTNSSSSSDEDTSSEDDSILENSITQNILSAPEECEPTPKCVTFNTIFPSMVDVYQTSLKVPSKDDMEKYRQYEKIRSVLMSSTAMSTYNPKKPLQNRQKRMIQLEPLGNYGDDSYRQVKPPTVSQAAIDTYQKYIDTPSKVYDRSPSVSDFNTIDKYFSMKLVKTSD